MGPQGSEASSQIPREKALLSQYESAEKRIKGAENYKGSRGNMSCLSVFEVTWQSQKPTEESSMGCVEGAGFLEAVGRFGIFVQEAPE